MLKELNLKGCVCHKLYLPLKISLEMHLYNVYLFIPLSFRDHSAALISNL